MNTYIDTILENLNRIDDSLETILLSEDILKSVSKHAKVDCATLCIKHAGLVHQMRKELEVVVKQWKEEQARKGK